VAIINPREWFGEYGWVWDAITWVSAGEAWPTGDEDQMRELAAAWRELAEVVRVALADADPAALRVIESWGGDAGAEFANFWQQVGVGPNTGLPVLQKAAAAFANGCDTAATEIEYAKLTILIAVAITVIAVFVALLMAWLGGVSAGAIPGILAAGRQAVTVAFRRLLAQLGRRMLTQAGMRAALQSSARIATTHITRAGAQRLGTQLGIELAQEIGEELIIDIGAQAFQVAQGNRDNWDGRRTLTAGVGGAFGGMLGFGGNRLLRNTVAPRVPVSFRPPAMNFRGAGIVRWGGRSVTAGMQNAVISPAASVAANLAVNQQWTNPGWQGALGGFTSGAGRGGATMAASSAGSAAAGWANRLGGVAPPTGVPGTVDLAGIAPLTSVDAAGLVLGATGSDPASGTGTAVPAPVTADPTPQTVPDSGAGSISLAPTTQDAPTTQAAPTVVDQPGIQPTVGAEPPPVVTSGQPSVVGVGDTATPANPPSTSTASPDITSPDVTASDVTASDGGPPVQVAAGAPAGVGTSAQAAAPAVTAAGPQSSPSTPGSTSTPAASSIAAASSAPAATSTPGPVQTGAQTTAQATAASTAGGNTTAAPQSSSTGTTSAPVRPPAPVAGPAAGPSAGSVSFGPAVAAPAAPAVPAQPGQSVGIPPGTTTTGPASAATSPTTTTSPTPPVLPPIGPPASAPPPAATTGGPDQPSGPAPRQPSSGTTVDPQTLQRSAGPTGTGTHSWQLDPVQFDGDPNSTDADQALIDASRALVDAVTGAVTRHQQQATPGEQISMGKRPGVVGALMTRSGQLTTHSSMTADQSTDPATQPTPHPLVETVLAEVAQQVSRVGSGHGRCAEVALVSDVVYQLERQWQDADRIGDFDAYARSELAGARIVTHQFRRAQDVDVVYERGDYRPPCRSCGPMLDDLGITPVVDTERLPGPAVPPDSGALGDGRALPDTRPTGDGQGLVPPDPADQQALTDEVPVGPDGRPARHPDPRGGRWPELVNDGGPANPGRGTNCADVGLSVLATWYGDPQVAAATGASVTAEPDSTRRQEQWLGASFAPAGRGPAGLDAVADQLRRAGPGSAALIITSWTAAAGGGAHTWNAVNHDGQIIWIDAQSRQVSDTAPIYGSEVDGVWSIVLDADGNPVPADGAQSTAVSTTGATSEAAYLDALTEPDRATLLAELAAAQVDADTILAELGAIGDRLNTDLGLAGTAALTPLGSEYRVKGAESLARKFSTDFEPKGYTLPEALAEINDVVRFSVRAPETDAYGPAVAGVLDALSASGHQVTDVKSFWHPGNRFFGLNCTLLSPTGRTYEVQFPTATSWAIGKQTHGPYEVMRDPARTPADRMHAFLDILAVNKAHDIAGRMPGGKPVLTERYGPPKDTSFAKWIGRQDQAGLRQDYVDWLAADPSRSFRQELAARGLDPSDLPGLDPDAIGSTDADPDLSLPPAVSDGRPDPAAGQRDSGGGRHRADPGGDLGPSDVEVGLPTGRGGVDPVRRPGAPQRPGSGPGDGGVGDAALHDGPVAERAGVDPDLPGDGRGLSAERLASLDRDAPYFDELSDRERKIVIDAVNAARVDADVIIGDIRQIIDEINSGQNFPGSLPLALLGVENCVKGSSSLARKFLVDFGAFGIDLSSALGEINDIVRFSVRCPDGDSYGTAVEGVLGGLESRGHQVESGKVFWRSGNRYYGCNVTLTSPGGRTYELQFPTSISWSVGKQTHAAYELVRDVSVEFSQRVGAFLEILALNRKSGLAGNLPGSLDSLLVRFGEPKFNGFAKWFSVVESSGLLQAGIRRKYLGWLESGGLTFSDILVAHGLGQEDVPGLLLDPTAVTDGRPEVPVLPAVPASESDGDPSERAGTSQRPRSDQGGDLGLPEQPLGLQARRSGVGPVRESGASHVPRRRSGDGGVGDASLHGGPVAERGGVDPDLSGGQPGLTSGQDDGGEAATDGHSGVPALPVVSPDQPDGHPGERDSPRRSSGSASGGGLGLPGESVGVRDGLGRVGPVRESGAAHVQPDRSGDGGVGDASLHDGAVAERSGVDPDLPGGQPDPTGTRPVSGEGRDTGSTSLASANAAGESSTLPEQGGVVDDRGRGQSTDQQTAGQQEPDRDVSVRVRLAGPGGVVDPGTASRDAHRSGELHRGPDGRGDRPAEPAGDGGGRGVRGGASAGPDLGSAGVAGAGPATGVADRAVPAEAGNAPLAGSRPVGPLNLAPLEDVGFQADLEAVLWSGGGFVVGADPSSHPFGGLVNDGGPGRSGRGNNCMDCSLAGLSTFLGRPMVSLPRWPDILPDGAVDRQTGEAAGVDRAEEWLGGEWVGPPADLPGGPQKRAVAVARQYAQLQERVAAAGPGSAALVVADWLSVDERTGQVQVDADGNALADGSHAFLIVYPYGADRPVWWDPQDGRTWPVPPTHIVAATHALWSMDAPAAGGGTNSDSGRSAGADPAAGRDAEPDGSARVRVRLAGAGDPESAGTRHGDAGRPGELHHRPGRDGDGARQSAGTGDDRPVRGGASAGADLGSAGVAGAGLAGNGVADGDAGVTDGTSGVVAGADELSGPRPVGPLNLAPLEDVGFQADLEAVLWSGGGFVVGADPSSHPFGGLVNDGGPGRSGRGNNCMDCSLAGLSTFLGRPMVSLPRWPDRAGDGTIDRVTGEADGIGRAEEWLGGEWVGPPADLPGTPADRVAAVAEQYAQLQQRVAAAGPGSAALVVADWLSFDQDTGRLHLDADGNAQAAGSHAFLIVYPYGADGPVWWDPQYGGTATQPPAEYLAATHTLWSMDAPTARGGIGSDSGRRAGADPAAGRDAEPDGAARVRVRLGGEGDPLGDGTHPRAGSGAGELGDRPRRDGDGPPEHAAVDHHAGVRGGPPGGPDDRPPGVAADGRAGAEPLATAGPDRSLSAAPDGLVSAAAGTTFGGALHDADPVAVAAAVRDALDTGLLPAGAVADPDAGTVTLDTSAGPVTVTLAVTSLPPGTTMAPVATIATHADGATVRVSDRASADHVRRAVAAALAEVDAIAQERADGLRTDATTVLAEGARPEGDGQRHLTARDIGRLAELRTVADQLAQAGTGRHADPAQVAQLHAEAVGLLISSGLLEPYPGHRVHSLVPNVPVVGSAATDARFAAVRTQLGPAFADLAGLLAAARDRPGLADEIRVVQADVRAAARRWAAQATDARDQADLALTDRVDAALDADPQHVFDRLVIGGGWAAMADFATLDAPPDTGDGLPPVLAVSQGHDPWADRQQLLMGQVPTELEIPGLPFQPVDFADEGTQFALASDFAAAVGAARAYTGMPSYQGTATAITPRPTGADDAAGWPADANYRVTVGERGFYAATVDIAAGPGPARVPAAPASTTGRYVDPATGYQVDRSGPIPVFRDPTGAAVDPATLPTPVRTVLGGTDIDTPTGRGTGQDDPPLLADTAGRLTDPLVVDPASGYTVDAGTGQVYAPDGSSVDPAALPVGVARRLGFDAAGRFTAPRSARPRVDFGGQNLADAYQPGDRVLVFGAGASGAWDIEQAAASPAATIDWSARAVGLPPADRTGDPARDAELQFQRSFSGGYNRRNTLPDVGAYDVAATDSRISQSLREIVSTRHTVDGTFLVEFSDGTRQEYDRVVISIGQAAEYPGGVAALAGALRLRPLHGPPALDRSTPDVIGLTDRSGQLRILGAAAVARQLGPSLGRFSDYLQDRLSDQAAALPDDSRNIPPSIRFHAQRIAEANRSSVPPPSHLPEVDESPPPGDGGVEPGQRPVRGGDPLGDFRDVDVDRILPADGVEAGTVGNEFGAVAREVDKSQVGQDSGGELGEQFGTDRGNTAVDQPQPAEPPQVRRGQQGAQPVVADRVVVQSEAGESGQHWARGDLTDQVRADVGEQDVADRNPAVDARAPVEEVGTGQLDQLGEATTYPAVVDEPGDPRAEPRLERDGESMHSPGQLGRDRGTGDLGPVVLDLQSDELGMVGVGGFDGVGVAQPQVHVVGVGEDGGVQGVADGSPAVAGVGHDRSVATPPALLPLPGTRLIGPQGLSPLEDPRYQSELEHSLTAPDGYQVGSDPAVHPYGRLINDGGPSQPGRGNNCLDASLAALASFYGQPQVALPRWPDPLPDGRTDWASGEANGIDRAEAWLGGQWASQPADMPGTPAERAERVGRQYEELHDQLTVGGPGSAALVVAEWLKLDRLTGQPAVDGDGNVVMHDAHAFVVVHPADADGPVWWDPQQGTVWTEPPTEYVEMTHTLWSMIVPPGEVPGDDGGRRAATDRTAGRDGESDRAASVRVRVAGEGDTVDRTAGDGGARRNGLLHHRPVGDGDGAQQPADTGGHEAVRGGEAAGPDQRAPDLAASRDSGPADPRLTRIRQLAAHYTAADSPTRLALRAEIGVLVDQLGLTGGTPQAYARWAQLPPDLANLLLRLTSPALAPETVLAVLGADPATLTEPQRAQQRDYRARLVHNGYVPYAPQLTEQLHRLAVDAEQGQRSLPTLPASAGQVIGLRADQLAQLQAVDPELAARIARDGVYVDLTGQVDIGPYVLANAPQVDVGGVHPGFDLATDAGRRALLAEDVRRAYATITATYGSSPAITQLLGSHSFHYLAQTRTMVLVSDALTRAILNLAPSAPVEPAPEAAPLAVGPTEIHVYADHPTLPSESTRRYSVGYGRPVDPYSGASVPLWRGMPRREQVQQGILGDCGMLASIGAVAGHSPQTIGGLFRPNPDGTVDVLLHESSLPGDRTTPTGRRLRITVTPDVPVLADPPPRAAYASQPEVGAAWASILEKALAAVDRTWTESRQVAWQQQWQGWQGWSDPNQAAPRGYARMDPGSTPDLWAEALTQLTGLPARMGRFDVSPGNEPTVEAMLSRLLSDGNPIIVSTKGIDEYGLGPDDELPFDLRDGHAYELVGVSNGHVQLRNPWNKWHPQPMPTRAFLDWMSRDFAHLDRVAPTQPGPPSLGPPSSIEHKPAVGLTEPVPVAASAGRVAASVTSGFGRTAVDRGEPMIVYYAIRTSSGQSRGIVVVVTEAADQRILVYGPGGDVSAASDLGVVAGTGGQLWPVARTEAERIASAELGFVLPDEASLSDSIVG